jgi:hypothetical protein
MTALEWEVNNNICRNRTLVSSASVDTDGHLSVSYVNR